MFSMCQTVHIVHEHHHYHHCTQKKNISSISSNLPIHINPLDHHSIRLSQFDEQQFQKIPHSCSYNIKKYQKGISLVSRASKSMYAEYELIDDFESNKIKSMPQIWQKKSTIQQDKGEKNLAKDKFKRKRTFSIELEATSIKQQNKFQIQQSDISSWGNQANLNLIKLEKLALCHKIKKQASIERHPSLSNTTYKINMFSPEIQSGDKIKDSLNFNQLFETSKNNLCNVQFSPNSVKTIPFCQQTASNTFMNFNNDGVQRLPLNETKKRFLYSKQRNKLFDDAISIVSQNIGESRVASDIPIEQSIIMGRSLTKFHPVSAKMECLSYEMFLSIDTEQCKTVSIKKFYNHYEQYYLREMKIYDKIAHSGEQNILFLRFTQNLMTNSKNTKEFVIVKESYDRTLGEDLNQNKMMLKCNFQMIQNYFNRFKDTLNEILDKLARINIYLDSSMQLEIDDFVVKEGHFKMHSLYKFCFDPTKSNSEKFKEVLEKLRKKLIGKLIFE